jgi:hypothetical protein
MSDNAIKYNTTKYAEHLKINLFLNILPIFNYSSQMNRIKK